MKYYRVLINGKNFRMSLNGEVNLLGFYTTRFVTAANPAEAETAAIKSLRASEKLASAVQNRKNIDPNPEMYIKEVEEISKSEMESDHGFAWYSFEDEDNSKPQDAIQG